MFIGRRLARDIMAKSDSFFIRAKTIALGGNFEQTSIDLGAYVDALGKSVLRIHNVAVQTYPNNVDDDWSITANSDSRFSYQLTTQSQTAMVDATDKSVIATGALQIVNDSSTPGLTFLSQDSDVLPQQWTQGYLVGVEQIYLGAQADAQLATASVVLVLECTVETLSQNAAMALALSQQ